MTIEAIATAGAMFLAFMCGMAFATVCKWCKGRRKDK